MAFEDTRWSLVIRAGAQGDGAREALSALCQVYWPPLYSFLRLRGYSKEDASDVLQGFFLALIEKDFVSKARPEIGRFRTFILTALTRYAANEHAKQTAIKRGGRVTFVRIDGEEAEDLHQRIPSRSRTPEEVYERQWALAILQQGMNKLEQYYQRSGKHALFCELRSVLASTADSLDYQALCGRLSMTEGALRVAVHRLKQRYREALTSVIQETVASPDDAADELQYLIEVLARPTQS